MTDEQKKKLRQSVQLDLLEVSGIPEIYWDEIVLDVRREDVDAYKRLNEIKQNIYDISEPRLDMKNLLICSSKTGNGKTSWAIKLLQFFIFKSAQHYPEEENGFFVPTTEFV